ncbi:2-phosphosulfolactate phosphatase [Leptolyngbya sp. FACHB-711]|uniref:2-phosphosulfolactate phosphatase n=1 Tax=unclassified Leptolyngbya TaxID=2650499 RepID=UPI00322065F0
MFNQSQFDVRCEWGEQGIFHLASISDVIVIVDVLSFSTCVEIANSRGAIVYPYQYKDDSVTAFAESINAKLANQRGGNGYSLSPASLLSVPQGLRLVLPSPNGSALSLSTGKTPTLAGCLRNGRAVALAAMAYGRKIAIVPAGEKWSDGSLRPAFEDWIGAGAIIRYLSGNLSPEAEAAAIAFQGLQHRLTQLMPQCSSGKELIERGFPQDVELAAAFNASNCVPTLIDGAYLHPDRSQ